ncbi:MAG: hypothetical protein U0412_00010 [Nitrospira sp.]
MQGFRHRARLAIRGRVGSPKIGLFLEGTHRVVHVPRCPVHHPIVNEVAGAVRRALVDTRLSAYSESAHQGLARYLQVVVERSSGTAQVVIVGNSESAEPFAACLDRLRERLGNALHSLWYNAQASQGNAILGARFTSCFGPASVIERFLAAQRSTIHRAFGQNNLEIARRIIDHIRSEVPAGSRVAELYAGVGAIGLSLLDGLGHLRINEASLDSLAGLSMGIAGLPEHLRARVEVMPGPASGACLAGHASDVIIVDPPRKGLCAEVLQYLREQPPSRLIYVSCGLDAFLRDAGALLDTGRMRIKGLLAFNLLPFTDHVETVATLERT